MTKKHLISALAMTALPCIVLQAQNKFDVNGDNAVNSADVVAVYNYIVTGETGETPHRTHKR